MDLIWFEVIIMLKGMFKVELALVFVFKRVNFAPQAFWTYFVPTKFFKAFFLPTTQRVWLPLSYIG